MNSEDIRNDPRMKAHWSKLSRERRMVRILTWGAFAILAASVLSMAMMSGCLRWPIVITGGGTGIGEGQTVPGGDK